MGKTKTTTTEPAKLQEQQRDQDKGFRMLIRESEQDRKDTYNVLLAAERYALGSDSMLVVSVIRYIGKHIDKLDSGLLSMMEKDIDSTLCAGKPAYRGDRDMWEELLEKIREKQGEHKGKKGRR